MAIEDAAALAEALLASKADAAAALQRFEATRRKRVGRVAHASVLMGRVYHLSHPWDFPRDLVIRNTPQKRLMARNDWLYGFRG
jgi:salicylate hydroxylase